ncbi:hypothetical protein PMAYCL1PPCAC_04623, partial [Pristionchus mayeri]
IIFRMAEWFTKTWDTLKFWGSHRTHVANGWRDMIYAMVDGDRVHVTNQSIKFKDISISGSSEIYHKANSIGFTAIRSREFTFFEPKHNEKVYITIFRMDNGNAVSVCEALSVDTNRSVIVDSH